jgi:hypothetical protein
MVVGGQYHAPAAYTRGRAPVPMVLEDVWVKGRSGRVLRTENFFPLPDFVSRSAQPIASRYANHAIPPPRKQSLAETYRLHEEHLWWNSFVWNVFLLYTCEQQTDGKYLGLRTARQLLWISAVNAEGRQWSRFCATGAWQGVVLS